MHTTQQINDCLDELSDGVSFVMFNIELLLVYVSMIL